MWLRMIWWTGKYWNEILRDSSLLSAIMHMALLISTKSRSWFTQGMMKLVTNWLKGNGLILHLRRSIKTFQLVKSKTLICIIIKLKIYLLKLKIKFSKVRLRCIKSLSSSIWMEMAMFHIKILKNILKL